MPPHFVREQSECVSYSVKDIGIVCLYERKELWLRAFNLDVKNNRFLYDELPNCQHPSKSYAAEGAQQELPSIKHQIANARTTAYMNDTQYLSVEPRHSLC